MGVPRFELLEPDTYEEASRLISAHETIPLAGGTAIISMMRQRLFNPPGFIQCQHLFARDTELIVSLNHIVE